MNVLDVDKTSARISKLPGATPITVRLLRDMLQQCAVNVPAFELDMAAEDRLVEALMEWRGWNHLHSHHELRQGLRAILEAHAREAA